ncbi:hypothetical protein [Ancylobacter pratisalsi]|uniref:Uncharacterized protein n=1 Tax=Ancylobacter pratisalsi TaxID=1745854 RepID=A0A6P1YI19_9HYPH|nr:hypothetical protein [Ancylobacter pratisalsi]QIB32610.1 hypothetical protein G3A50_02000 [Ancylobacter pratisalsi]
MPRHTAELAAPRHTTGRRLRRALLEAGLVLSLTLAIVAVLCMFGLQRVSALEIHPAAASDARIAMGAVLLAGFVGMCGLTSFMLRSTLQPDARDAASRRREG